MGANGWLWNGSGVLMDCYGWLRLASGVGWLWLVTDGYGVVRGAYKWLLGVMGGNGWSWGGNL